MNTRLTWIAVVLSCVLITACGQEQGNHMVASEVSALSESKQLPYAPDEVLVKFQPSVSADQVNSELGPALALSRVRNRTSLGVDRMRIDSKESVEEAVERLRLDPRVVYAEPNWKIKLLDTPDDPRYGECWGLNNTGQTGGTPDADIDAPEAWDISTGSSSVVVAVLDTGVDYNHPDLIDNMWINQDEIPDNGIDDDTNGYIDDVLGWNFEDEDNDPIDFYSHGTHCSGIIGAVGNNGTGVAGVNWQVSIMPLRIIGYQDHEGFCSDAAEGIIYAVDNGAHIMSCSWWTDQHYSQTLEDAVAYSNQRGVLLAAAAGNQSRDSDDPAFQVWPAEWPYENIISVAATDHRDYRAWFSNWGLVSVDVGAPGEEILSTYWPGGDYQSRSGTSMAAPHVAGTLALMLSVNPDLSAAELKNVLFGTVDPVSSLQGITVTGGRINAHRALQALSGVQFPPVAAAGKDLHVLTGSVVQLDGSESYDPNLDALTYQWTLFPPPGSAAVLTDPGAVNPQFTADVCGDYETELVVNDGNSDSQPDRVKTFARNQTTTLIETPHPYDNYMNQTWTITHPSALHMAVHFADFDTEVNRDYVRLLDGNDMLRATFHGDLGEFTSGSIPGDTIKIFFSSNYSVTRYGFQVDAYRWCDDGSCPAGFGDCDGNSANGCETDLRFDDNNCGWCDHVCAYLHATTGCLDTVCTITGCDAGWGDCDGGYYNGCETSLSSDAGNCGACGNACAFSHASASCAAGACVMGLCFTGWEDRDGQTGNGCETSLRSDADNCGSCGNVCNLPHASSRCVLGVCYPDVCDPGWLNCDTEPSNGCEADPTGDPQNCGGCGNVCSYPHAHGVCTDSSCGMGACHNGWNNCDSDQGTGCESFTDTDVNNCGACDNVCQLDNAVPVCVQGGCRLAFCSDGFGNCDGDDANGCEADLSDDPGNCGTCGNACSFDHAEALCTGGACALGTCHSGWDNCNGHPSDGCEIDTNADVQNCGTCWNACSLPHATPACSNGTCVPGTCDADWGNCNNWPADGCETDLTGTLDHCGACGRACAYDNAAASCTGGNCVMGACRTGFDNCDGLDSSGCEVDLDTDTGHCGACNNACSFPNASALCDLGRCTLGACIDGYANCNGISSDGCEIDLTSDTNNCSACGTICAFDHAAASCSAGTCIMGVCDAGFDNCDLQDTNGCEVELAVDTANCGTCGNTCAFEHASAVCATGVCAMGSCDAGFDNCDGMEESGCEVELAVDPLHCGACGSVCELDNATAGCLDGTCVVAACDDGFWDCNLEAADGCEVDLQTDPGNCDSCGNACAFDNAEALCQEGSCVMGDCAEAYADCNQDDTDGCEADLQSDPDNCDVCGSVCAFDNAAALCQEGVCAPGECLEGFGDCDADPQTGCETDLTGDAQHCGLCAADCAPGEICEAGVCACADGDEDGYLSGDCGGDDCDDANADIHPGAEETCDDGVDQDCNGADLQCDCTDADGDGFVAVDCGGDDCDDGDSNIFPGAGEMCGDDVDQDCDGEDLKCKKVDDGCGCGGQAGGEQALFLLLVFLALLARRR